MDAEIAIAGTPEVTRARTRKRTRVVRTVVVLTALAVLGAFAVWYNLYRTRPSAAASSPREHFVYASIGTEGLEGVPYWLWLILPKVFPEYLPGPGGYAALGMSWEPGHELPMGVTREFIGVDRVGINCAFCHVSQVRLTPQQGEPTLYVAGPSHQFRAQEYQQFLFQSAQDPRFDADVLMPAIAQVTTLSTREALLYRYLLIPATKRALLRQKEQFAWQNEHDRPRHGPGRVDPFNPIRFGMFGEGDDGSVGNADIPAIWNQGAKKGLYLHWDGLSRRFFDVAISSAIGDGAREKYLDVDSLKRVEGFLMNLPPPPYPLPIDAARAEQGRGLFAAHCASCHEKGGAKFGAVMALDDIGTDPHRAESWTQSQVVAWKQLASEYQREYDATWNLDTMAKPGGYVNGLLDGIWLRGPYLHNGSVPSLRALLDAPNERPAVFFRGNDLLDGANVGFVSNVEQENGRKFFRYDTRLPGNGNGGHSYGTTLTVVEKDALLEHLKTL